MGAQSTVFAGGRYDGLVEYFGGPQGMSGIGWALGLERLLLACRGGRHRSGGESGLDAYVLCLAPQARQLPCSWSRSAQQWLSLRHGLPGAFLKAQFKSVERKHARTAIFLGDKELESGEVTIKEIDTQKQHTVPLNDIVAVMDRLFDETQEAEGGCTAVMYTNRERKSDEKDTYKWRTASAGCR
ncbi:MAG: His/Gly/Thr/Pro-type tRNA ligase C-terminal domain-containing protein [Merdibacter sp.]